MDGGQFTHLTNPDKEQPKDGFRISISQKDTIILSSEKL
jgi:hypothetical protein